MTVQITPGLPQRGEGWLIRGEPRTIAADIDTTAPLTLHLGGGRPSAPVLSLPPSRTDGDLTCWDLSVAQVDQITDGLASVRVWIAAGPTSVVAGQLMVARQGDSAPGGRTVLTAARVVVGPQGIGVVSAGTTPGGHLVFVLDTGEVLDAGMVPVPPSVEAAASSAASSASTATAEAAAAGLSATAAQDAATSATASASTATAMAASAATARDQTLAVTGDITAALQAILDGTA